MTCQQLRDGIVDVARGRDVGLGTAAAIESHVQHCAACAAQLAREQELSAGLRALAASAASAGPSDRVGQNLRQAFEAHRETSRVAGSRWWWQVAAAAFAAAALVWWRMPDPGAGQRAPAIETRSASAGPASSGSTKPPQVVAPLTPGIVAAPPSRAPRMDVRSRRSDRQVSSPVITAEGFVFLPAAMELPDFESGSIVRMELPVTSLPEYGIEIVPSLVRSVTDGSVEADLLVGQDGQPRAIRLVAAGPS